MNLNYAAIQFKLSFIIAGVIASAQPVVAADPPKPLRALLITGGCCHDYAAQKDILKKGIEERALIVVDQVHTDDKSTKPPLAILGNPDYAKGYDVVIHDECAADISEPAKISAVLAPHKNGIPGVNLHCAMHSYRIGKASELAAIGSERAMWFDYLGIQSSGHGPKLPLSITTIDSKHPVTNGLGWDAWTTIEEELYNNVDLHKTATSLQRSKQNVKQKDGTTKEAEAVVTWTNDYAGIRVFSTTVGHFNETVADDRYLDLVTRGILWSCDKLNDTYLKPSL